MTPVWKAAFEEFKSGRPFVLAVILSVAGSTPRHVGTRFLIKKDGTTVGTIGGGKFESEVVHSAIDALSSGRSSRVFFTFRGHDADSLEMICGGEAEVLVEYFSPSHTENEILLTEIADPKRNRISAHLLTNIDIPVGESKSGCFSHVFLDGDGGKVGAFEGDASAIKCIPPMSNLSSAQFLTVDGSKEVFLEYYHPAGTAYIFGAGHVGVAVAKITKFVNFKTVLIDDRPEFANELRVPEADTVIAQDFDTIFDKLAINEDSYIVIVTRGHSHDKVVLGKALKTSAGYIGMIGSRRKTALIFDALLKEGITASEIQRVKAPIGLPIGGETPEEIAISIVAQLIEFRTEKKKLSKQGPSMCPA